MTFRILSADEIEALSSQADFSEAAGSAATTMDFRPIDSAVSECRRALSEAQGLPAFEFHGSLRHPPIPEALRRYVPEADWEGRSEPVALDVRGVEAGGYRILHFAAPGQQDGGEVWGLPQGALRLVFHRDMPIGPVSRVTAKRLRAAFAAQEASAIGAAAGPGRAAEKPPRI